MSLLTTLRVRFAQAVADLTTLDLNAPETAALALMVRPSAEQKKGGKPGGKGGAVALGDYQANMAMPLGKQLGRQPQLVAQQLIDRVEVADVCEPPTIAGPGFINLAVRDAVIAEQAAALLGDDSLGITPTEQPRTIVVDFSSPNVAKPMHVGHLRSTVIGDALQRVLRRLGHRVISDNHIGDWGTQFGMILWGYKHLLDEAAYASTPVEELARLYRTVVQLQSYQRARNELPTLEDAVAPMQAAAQRARDEPEPTADDPKEAKKLAKQHKKAVARAEANAAAAVSAVESAKATIAALPDELKPLAEQHDDIATAARLETAKLHAGDAENRRLWEEFLPHCLASLQQVYDRLGIHFDQAKGESHFQPRLAGTVEKLQAAGLASESDGAVVVFPRDVDPAADDDAAPLIVRKSDGAFTYATTDLATIEERLEDERADAMLYVVDARQAEHFQRVFQTAAKLFASDPPPEFRHVAFGTVLGEDGRPFKTRAGDTVGLESLLDEAVSQARRIVEENEAAKPDDERLADDQRDRIAELVGLGGVKYADLKHNRESDYAFSWEKMLSKTGDTATYLQYAYARTRGILRKAAAAGTEVVEGPIDVSSPAERALALKLLRYPEAVEAVAAELRPHLLTTYLFELAGAFSTFFEQCPVLRADDEASRASRVRLVELTGRVLRDGLSLLGIAVSERM